MRLMTSERVKPLVNDAWGSRKSGVAFFGLLVVFGVPVGFVGYGQFFLL
jgi:hypothetical protein